MSQTERIGEILSLKHFAVVGASRSSDKYGYKVYKALKQAGYTVFPVNPNADTVDGDTCYPSLDNISAQIDCVVTITPPVITENAVHLAGLLRVPYVWMQPGSESVSAVHAAHAAGIQDVSDGSCILVALTTKKHNV